MICVRHANKDDIAQLLSLFEEARRTIATLGIDQWQNGYPGIDVILQDIAKKQSFVVLKNNQLVASFVLLADVEPTYKTIYDGDWLTGTTEKYTAIHRFAIALSSRGGGIAEHILAFAEQTARARGNISLRIDTHKGNVVMRRMLEKNHFIHCGTIFLEGGDARVAYERKIMCE